MKNRIKVLQVKYSLPFPLIADTSKKILNDYGVWGEKKMYGKELFGGYQNNICN